MNLHTTSPERVDKKILILLTCEIQEYTSDNHFLQFDHPVQCEPTVTYYSCFIQLLLTRRVWILLWQQTIIKTFLKNKTFLLFFKLSCTRFSKVLHNVSQNAIYGKCQNVNLCAEFPINDPGNGDIESIQEVINTI